MSESVEQVVEKAVEDVNQNKTSIEDQNQALNVLVQAVRLAQKRGAYELEETEIILKAIKLFNPSK